jgi:hypothetical protein
VGGNLTVTGTTTFNGGTITMGDAATDNVVFGADINSSIIPNTDDTYDLGSSSQEWRNLYIDGTANIDSLVADTADINAGTIDGATIATSDITVGSGKTLDVSAGTLTLADDQISGDKVEGGTIAATTVTALTFGSLNDGTITVTAFVDEDNMASDSATLIPTQQSVKAYVDTTVAATNEVVEDTTPQLGGDLDTNGNDILFADNDKAIFGAGSDLQIYHEGSNSYIKENGTGGLVLQSNGTAIVLEQTDGENMIVAYTNGDVKLYYNGSEKLSTTSTGIDVTGTATMDGLTVEGSSTGTLSVVNFLNTDTSANQTANRLGLGISNSSGANYTYIEAKETGVDAFAEMNFYTGTTATKRMTLGTYGDISFYDDTGTSQALFWDASTERLGIGNTAPTSALDVTGIATMDGLVVDSTTGFSWLPVSTAGAEVGVIGTGTGLIINTPSVNSGYGSGLAIDGSYASALSSVNIKAFGAKFASYGSELNLFTSDDTSLLKRQTIASNGDISFYEDTGTTAKLFWDASEETLFVDQKIKVGNTTDGVVLQTSAGMGSIIGTDTGGNGWNALDIRAGSATQLYLNTSGNVGIGTDSPSVALQVQSSTTQAGRSLRLAYDGSYYTEIAGKASGGVSYNAVNPTAGGHRFEIDSTERMRIDSSGNLLVDKTAIGLNTVGFEVRPNGIMASTRDGGSSAYFNRKTSDGSVVEFQKDGTTVGSIGVQGGNKLVIGSGDTGIRFAVDNDALHPWNVTTNGLRDAAIDLGADSIRFKDLYLSGNASVGSISTPTAGTSNFVAGVNAGNSIDKRW